MISSSTRPSCRLRYTSGATPRSDDVRPVMSMPSISGKPQSFAIVGAMSTCRDGASVTSPLRMPGPEKISGERDWITSSAPCCPGWRPNAYAFGFTTRSGAFGLSNSCAMRSYANG